MNARHQLVEHYNQAFYRYAEIKPLSQHPDSFSSYHLYVVRLISLTQEQHKACVGYLRQHGIVGHLHYIPIYLQPYYQQLGFKAGYCPKAELYYQHALTIPLFPSLSLQEQNTVVNTLDRFLCQL